MTLGLIALAGERIAAEALHSTRARAFARYLDNSDNHAFTLLECRHTERADALCLLVRSEVPQHPRYDIRYEEPLAVIFDVTDRFLPDVLALREDFPQVPHLNLRYEPVPKSLCLFAERPEELSLRWTPALLGERILWWLRETAYGTLHQDDQALEPFLGGIPRPLILPPDLLALADTEVLRVYEVDSRVNGNVLVADRADAVPAGRATASFTLLPFALPVQEHGIIHTEPSSLMELHTLCMGAGVDFLMLLRRRLQEKVSQIKADTRGTILVLAVPKTRHHAGEAEALDFYGFRCAQATPQGVGQDVGPGRLGEMLGVLGRTERDYVPLIASDIDYRLAAATVPVLMLAPRVIQTAQTAALLSGHARRDDTRILAIGQGALGSQVFSTLARQGFGQWTMVDEDYIAPHNVTRHAVLSRCFGQPKATEMAARMNEMFAGPPIAEAIVADVLAPGSRAQDIAMRASESGLILDLSASVAVARHLTLDVEAQARRAAAFLSPSGHDLVVMAEDATRSIPLDVIETQYLRAVQSSKALEGHLTGGTHARYGGSCRDLTARISQEMAALHGAIAARAVREIVSEEHAYLTVWRCDPDRMTVERHDFPLAQALVSTIANWTVVTDEGLRQKVAAYRASKLPKETCGVLLGYLDTQRRRIYVCDVLPAPLDSVEEEEGCQRGIALLAQETDSASDRTLGQLSYIGEWHSHPDGATCLPSEPDAEQMTWVKRRMHPEGKPALMLITCEDGALTFFVSEP